MAARMRPDRSSAEQPSMLQFPGQSTWDEVALVGARRAAAMPVLTAVEPAASFRRGAGTRSRWRGR